MKYSIEDFARNVKRIRKSKKMTYYKLAQKSGISQSALNRAEMPDGNPTLYVVLGICEGLNVNIEDLFKVEENEDEEIDNGGSSDRLGVMLDWLQQNGYKRATSHGERISDSNRGSYRGNGENGSK